MDTIDNSEEFLKKMEGRPKEIVPIYRQVGRRTISHGLGRKRKFAGIIYGEALLHGGSLDSSGTVSLGASLPSCEEMVKREEEAELRKKFLRRARKSFPKKDDERFRV